MIREIPGDDSDVRGIHLLVTALQVAVPLWIHEVGRLTETERLQAAHDCSEYISSHGDAIIYRSYVHGETAAAFNHLARGLACMAYLPGGVTYHGTHFCTDHPACEAGGAR